MGLFDKYETLLDQTDTIRSWGEVQSIQGLLIQSKGPECGVGELATIHLPDGRHAFAEVVSRDDKRVQMMALTDTFGLVRGSPVFTKGRTLEIPVGLELLGRVLDGIGQSLDGQALNFYHNTRSIFSTPAGILERKLISDPIETGVRAIDGLLTLGLGQRIGIFAGSGVGKSTLLSMIARNTSADVNVIALLGERRREVQEFMERDLGPEGMKRSVMVVATADDPPLARVRGLYTATTIAEYFREQGKHVMLIVDSVTRAAMAQREIGATLGEVPISRGYGPSVPAMLARVLERAGATQTGTITGLYNVLVEGDDLDEPVSDAIRGIVDGHIVLSRALAHKNQYPAIDVPGSISRMMIHITEAEHQAAADQVREWISTHREIEDLINIGAYVRGTNPVADQAIAHLPEIKAFLKQDIHEQSASSETLERLKALSGGRTRGEGLLRGNRARTSVLGGPA